MVPFICSTATEINKLGINIDGKERNFARGGVLTGGEDAQRQRWSESDAAGNEAEQIEETAAGSRSDEGNRVADDERISDGGGAPA
jgi:hypothetical protein